VITFAHILTQLSNVIIRMESRSENVILVVLDGVRTQEMFGGLDKNLVTKIMHEAHPNQKVEDQPFYKKYWAETVEERRQKVMPWFWSEFLKNNGCIVGDRQNGTTPILRYFHEGIRLTLFTNRLRCPGRKQVQIFVSWLLRVADGHSSRRD
jgi:hypothetical protein